MKNEITLKIKSNFIDKYKNGYPLIFQESILNLASLREEGAIVTLVDEKNHFIARGYYGRQNKGYGWVLSRKINEEIDEAFFQSSIASALNQRKSLYQDTETTAFRAFNGEGDGIGGFTIDYFDGYYLINWYSEGIYRFKDMILGALTSLVDPKAIYQKKRFDSSGQYIEADDFVLGERPEFPLIVKENGVNFAIYLNDGAMVGVFLDQRDVRKKIRDQYAKNRSVLNTFSYTGAFSVFAALGGATNTTSVDLANRSLPKTIEQFNINGIDEKDQTIIVQDVFQYFKYANRKNLQFDMVILDPPSFARSKKHTFSASKDYTDLLKQTISITADKGIIVASTNCSTFNMNTFKGFIDKAFKEMKANYRLVEEFSLPEDFKTIKAFTQGNYLKVLFIEKV
ncbi:conserved hypothetical protein [Alkaliphilus metalliredigens QYMF]|uniref:PUA domain containing protein n=1 Tax=Alkaliphilus metalliredigens (strain QYMF) TaxID=293826 RepID=A6TTV1_ALKMQ|nr:class I SAM-dependent rRNA methyltransferase [Alkaliphilus metalliredigens]ABR49619.1 conserved hypothetical protein [Alkaliphilus metalliredigens QYMF]